MMKKTLFLAIAILLSSLILSAQKMPAPDYGLSKPSAAAVEASVPSAMQQSGVQPDVLPVSMEKAMRQMKTGRDLLISGAAFLAGGAGMYAGGLLAMGDGNALASALTISGITCAGLSVGMTVAGAVLYAKGSKTVKLAATPTGLALNF